MRIWCARCAAYTQQHLTFVRKQFTGEYKCERCGNIKKNPRGYVPMGGSR